MSVVPGFLAYAKPLGVTREPENTTDLDRRSETWLMFPIASVDPLMAWKT